MDIDSALKEEYLFLQSTYEDFDTRALTIKGWCITISLGAAAIGFDKSGFSNSLWIFILLSALLFWTIEAKWKTYQYAYAYRIRILEAHFRGDENYKDVVPFQIYNSWFLAYSQDPPVHEYEKHIKKPSLPLDRAFKNATLSTVFIPYLPIALAALAALILP